MLGSMTDHIDKGMTVQVESTNGSLIVNSANRTNAAMRPLGAVSIEQELHRSNAHMLPRKKLNASPIFCVFVIWMRLRIGMGKKSITISETMFGKDVN